MNTKRYLFASLLNVCLLLFACSRQPGFTPCGKDWCEPGTHCEEQTCLPGCIDDDNCADGLLCSGGRCLAGRGAPNPRNDARCVDCEKEPPVSDASVRNDDTNNANNNLEDAGCVGCNEEDSSVNDFYSARCRAYADKVYACFPKSSEDWDDHAYTCRLIETTGACLPTVTCTLAVSCDELRTGKCSSCEGD